MWQILQIGYKCHNTSNQVLAYDDYLKEHQALRFSYTCEIFPNVEVKIPYSILDNWALENRLKVVLNDTPIFISPIELQIAYKLYLGSLKDLEDAKHLYYFFKSKLDNPILLKFVNELGQQETFRRWFSD